MADSTEKHALEGGSKISQSDNMEIIMKAITDLREHQRQIEERLGATPSSTQRDMFVSGRNRNQAGDLLIQYMKFAPEEFKEWLQNAEHVLEHVSDDKNAWG
ncbi:hypothetical protein MKW94_010210 [Papaver nudicaule]|uniref:Uncharacterized protein n=1 Tax=Papaver nudicaule TaxID=74823 RepID=A0AA41VJP6_PAPNU|nr:hypothetical protein [Papaver nudicaule]